MEKEPTEYRVILGRHDEDGNWIRGRIKERTRSANLFRKPFDTSKVDAINRATRRLWDQRMHLEDQLRDINHQAVDLQRSEYKPDGYRWKGWTLVKS
jgi:hypothetical protein